MFHAEDGVPRSFVIWALFDQGSHELCIRGEIDKILPEKWFSGNYFWMMEICAPYSQVHATTTLRWCYENFARRDAPWFYCRADRPRDSARFIKVTPLAEGQNRVTRLTEAEMLADAPALAL